MEQKETPAEQPEGDKTFEQQMADALKDMLNEMTESSERVYGETIAESWDIYVNRELKNVQMSEIGKRELRRAFYAGAACIVAKAIEPISKVEGGEQARLSLMVAAALRGFEAIGDCADEIVEFGRAVIGGEA